MVYASMPNFIRISLLRHPSWAKTPNLATFINYLPRNAETNFNVDASVCNYKPYTIQQYQSHFLVKHCNGNLTFTNYTAEKPHTPPPQVKLPYLQNPLRKSYQIYNMHHHGTSH